MADNSSYRQRVIDHELDDLMTSLPAIAVEGAKGVGKTATARQRAATLLMLDDPAQVELVRADPERALTSPPPVLIDEWQRFPSLWDGVRRAVDEGAEPGSYLLTGSAGPRLAADGPGTHSGAGRIDVLRMRPMALCERLATEPTVSLSTLAAGGRPAIEGESDLRLEGYVDEIVRSGFPGIRNLDGRALSLRLAGYLDRVIDRDIPDELGRQMRKPQALRRWLQVYAAATSSTMTSVKIREAAGGRDTPPATHTTRSYHEALERLFILDPVPGWSRSNNRLARLNLAPKHQLVDPALAANLLGAGPDALLTGNEPRTPVPRDGTLLGALFESLATLSIRVCAQPSDLTVGHLRTKGGVREVDLILEDRAGQIVAIEVKLSATVEDHDVRHLNWLSRELGDDLLDSIIITTGLKAYRRSDGVAVVPLALLGP